MISIDETAEILGISPATAKNWARLGKLPSIKKGKQYLLDRAIVLDLKKNLADSDLLKRRRNKSSANGKFIPKSYISKASKNYSEIDCIIKTLGELNNLTEKDIPAILAYFGRAFTACLSLSTECKEKLISPLLSVSDDRYTRFEAILKDYTLSYTEGEDTLGMLYISLRSLKVKKASGAYYTPFFVVDKCIENLQLSKSMTICDPSCGTGNFLLRLPLDIPLKNIYGFDIDEIAVAIARINLAVKYDIRNTGDIDTLLNNIRCDNFLIPEKKGREQLKFDHILGNPPWGYSYSKDEIENLSKKYICARVSGNPESFSLFTERALNCLSDKGTMSFVLPETILGAGVHENIRSIIAENSHITSLFYIGEIFDNVQCPCILLTLSKPASLNSRVCVSFYKKSLSSKNKTDTLKGIFPERLILTKSFDTNCESLDISSFHMLADDKEKALLSKIENTDHFTLSGNCKFALGIVTGANKALLSPVKKAGYEEIIKGSDIDRYAVKEVSNYIKYEPGKFQQIAPKNMYRAQEKLLYKFICNKLVFAYDDRGRLSLNSANILIPKVENYSMLYILAVLNSSVISFYYSHTCKNMKVLRSEIERMPIAKCSKETEAEIAELAKKAVILDNPNKIIDEINSKIALLYGLSSDDIKLLTKNPK